MMTTIALSGIRKKFMIVERAISGTRALLSVPMAGQKIPTHISNAMKATKISNWF
jgi:hypothetical protein